MKTSFPCLIAKYISSENGTAANLRGWKWFDWCERYNVIWHHLQKEWQAGLRVTFFDSLQTTGGIYRELNSSIAFVVEAVKLQRNGDNFVYKRPIYSYGWKRGWRWPCSDTNLRALLCKSSYSYANWYFSRTISITKQRRFVSKQGHRQPHIHSKDRVLSPQL